MQVNMDRFRETFFEEAAEHVLNMESAILAMEDSPGDRDLLNTIFRGAHSIKGGSGTFGLDEVACFTHSLENLLDKMRAGAIEVSAERLDLMLRSLDVLRGLLATAAGEPETTLEVEQVLAELKNILGEDSTVPNTRPKDVHPQASSQRHTYCVTFVPDKDILRQGMDPLLLLLDLSRIGTLIDTKADLSRLPPLADLDPESSYLGWSTLLVAPQTSEQVAEVFAFVQDSSQVTIGVQGDSLDEACDRGGSCETHAKREAEVAHVRLHVPLEKATDLIRLAGSLVHAHSGLVRAAGDLVASAWSRT
jgi:two-component system chemotaxis sensor kinase CheA